MNYLRFWNWGTTTSGSLNCLPALSRRNLPRSILETRIKLTPSTHPWIVCKPLTWQILSSSSWSHRSTCKSTTFSSVRPTRKLESYTPIYQLERMHFKVCGLEIICCAFATKYTIFDYGQSCFIFVFSPVTICAH